MSQLTIHAWLYSVSYCCFVRSLLHLRRIRSYLYWPVTVNFLFTSIRLSVRLDSRGYLNNTQNILNMKLTRLVQSLFLVTKHMTERLCVLGGTVGELVPVFLAEEQTYRLLLFSLLLRDTNWENDVGDQLEYSSCGLSCSIPRSFYLERHTLRDIPRNGCEEDWLPCTLPFNSLS